MIQRVPLWWFFVLFMVSGFSGLVYESIWSHYLRLFLGHAAYAQTLVLAIFMGGMALGSWLCSRYAGRWPNLLVGYAVAEGVIGLLALVFHPLYVATTDFAFDSAMPHLGTPAAAAGLKWVLAALLVLPQSVLLGATFPLMSVGLIRRFPERAGRTLALLYFTNSLGGAAGVLISGFVLIRSVGLPGTAMTAGLVNIALAIVVWLLARGSAETSSGPAARTAARRSAPGYTLMLLVALLTGAASFIYEIGWIRMLSMVLGSSTHAFELMLSAFILGLAFGGLWIHRRIDAFAVPESALGVIQVAMGLLALATLAVYGETFGAMRWLLQVVAKTDTGYAAFNLGSHLIAMLVMFPAAFCAGMTLPLITHALLRRGHGEGAVGAVYAANTLGAIVGVVLATHLGMPVLGLKGLITAGAGLDILLGLVLLWRFASRPWALRFAAGLGAAGIAATLLAGDLDSLKMASGVYRQGRLIAPGAAEVLFHRDGKTATVNVLRSGGTLSITTNGKSDAMIPLSGVSTGADDDSTMVMLAALPLALHPEARTAAVIGFGSGISSHVLLASDALTRVDTVEIEPAMIEGARAFHPRNRLAFEDPRSRLHIEDARTFFSVQGGRYDIIASEPSNPWVGGVAGLFTDEFYQRVKRHLAPQGVLVQWLQLYEIDIRLVASVMKPLARNFRHYEIYAADDSNIIVLARDDAPLPRPSDAVFLQRRLAAELARFGIASGADLEFYRVGSRRALQPYFEHQAVPSNSDYFPVLEQNAAGARFAGARADQILALADAPLPALELLGSPPRRAVPVAPRPWLQRSRHAHVAQQAAHYLASGDIARLAALPPSVRSEFQLVRLALVECRALGVLVSPEQLHAAANVLLPYLAAGEGRKAWSRLRSAPCAPATGELSDWVALYEAIDARDAPAVARFAEGLLEARGAGQANRDFLFAAAVTGRFAAGEREQARALWRRYAPGLQTASRNPLPELLKAHVFGAQQGEGI